MNSIDYGMGQTNIDHDTGIRYGVISIHEVTQPNETLQKYMRDDGIVWSHAWPGGYPIYYITADCGTLCPDCVNKNLKLLNDKNDKQWYVVGAECNYENDSLYCDNCNKQIESAYGEPDKE